MGIQRIDVHGHSDADPATIYALLRDGSTWPTWSPIDKFVLERAGEPEPESVGAIRNIHSGKYKMRERVAELVPDKRFSYELLSGLALKGYRADIDLTPVAGGTDIHWHTTFKAKVPGTGWIYQRALRKITANFVTHLVAYTAAK
jgi:hypothetical protein